MVFLSLVSFFVFITNKRQPRFSIHAHAHTRHSPYKKFRVGKYKWSSTVSLFCFIFLFFFLFCFVFNPEFFFSDFWVRKNSRSIIFLNFFLSPSLPLSLSLSLSISLFHPYITFTRAYNSSHSYFIFFLFFYSRLLYLFFLLLLLLVIYLHDYSLSRVSYLSYYTFCFFFTPFKSQLRY